MGKRICDYVAIAVLATVVMMVKCAEAHGGRVEVVDRIVGMIAMLWLVFRAARFVALVWDAQFGDIPDMPSKIPPPEKGERRQL
jgi:hypothetical protein